MGENRLKGLLIMITAPIAMVVYALVVLYFPTQILQLTAIAIFVTAMGLVTWVGYTMFTEPLPPQAVSSSELDHLRPETINPPGEIRTFSVLPKFSVIYDAEIGEGTIVRDHVNLYRCKVGKNCKIESFVYIEEGVVIGDNCKIKPHVFIPSGVTIEDDVFIGPNVTFSNDKYPHAKGDWKLLKTSVGLGCTIGANAVVLPGVRIGRNAMVGAGAVVTSDIPDGAIVCGNPARLIEK